ncbi:MAG: 30S ribosomal protein S2 [Anaerolineae bacterium]|nr:30S ribosomal protein S2 [Anaerolineae bacterium]
MSLDVSMKDLLESGVHFGHRTNRWDPRMKPFIFTERNGIHIIDLQQTVQSLEKAYNLIRDTVAAGGTILFVGTKRQAQETIQAEAERCGMPYVMERWLPGTITNWVTIHQRIMELERLEKMRDTGEIDRLVKKEGLLIEREIKRLLVHLSGIRNMKGLPELVFIVDVMRENTAVHEANLKGIPIIAMVDTNCDPTNVDYVIPANDDAIRAIKLMVAKIADAAIEGKSMRKEEDLEEEVEQPIGEDDTRQRSRGRIQLEEDFDDEALLGKATLQKLADSKREKDAETTVETTETETQAFDFDDEDEEE